MVNPTLQLLKPALKLLTSTVASAGGAGSLGTTLARGALDMRREGVDEGKAVRESRFRDLGSRFRDSLPLDARAEVLSRLRRPASFWETWCFFL